MYLLQFIFLYFLVEILCKKLKISQTLVHHLNQNFDSDVSSECTTAMLLLLVNTIASEGNNMNITAQQTTYTYVYCVFTT